jgi:electron transfer flavoprotein alpha subunit
MTVLTLIELDTAGGSAAAGGTAAGGTAAPADASLRALNLARSLAGSAPSAAGIAAVVFTGSSAVPSSTLAEYGVSDVYVVEPSSLDGYAPLAWARVLARLAAETGATAVLAAGTEHGNEVLAHLGAITGLPMAANCTSITPDKDSDSDSVGGSDGGSDGGSVGGSGGGSSGGGGVGSGGGVHRLVRHRWAGLLLEDAVLEAPIALCTVATDGIPNVPAAAAAPITVHVHKPELAEADLVVRAVESAAGAGGVSLATARVVIGGGRGVGGPDGFAPLEELAELLGGVVGVSRVVTSEGWRPHRQQVGQTGTKITPELYLACGISGAIQHIAGCAGAKHIIAINTDPGAPILTHADYTIIGDLHKVVPALVTALRTR